MRATERIVRPPTRFASIGLNRIVRFMICIPMLWVGCDRPTQTDTGEVKSATDPVSLMREAMAVNNWELARQRSRQALIAEPDDPDVLTHAAKAAAMCGHKREAARLMVDAATISDYPVQRVDFAVHALIDVGELYAAIDLLQRALAAHPSDDSVRIKLAGFLCEAQRNQLVEPYYRALICKRKFDLNMLVAMTDSSNRQFSEKATKLMLDRNPADQRVRLGEARVLMDDRNAVEARRVVEAILEQYPRFAPAHALLGQILVAQAKVDEIPDWYELAPPDSDQQVDYWLTMGDWAASHNQHAWAARGYWEATRRDPNHSTAWWRLALAIRRLRDSGAELADAVSEDQLHRIDQRIANLLLLRKQFTSFFWSGYESQRYATEVARTLSKLGRQWEAEAWAAAATNLTKDPSDELTTLRDSIIRKLRRESNWYSIRSNPELAIDLSRFPSPILSDEPSPNHTIVAPLVESTHHLRMSEESDRWGLDSVGANNNPSDPKTSPLVRSTGVGGGAIDYDLDGRADAIVMGAGGTILKSDSFPNELLRNQGTSFDRVTDLAEVGHTDFGQGACVGDYNEDGFPDLFFANLGKNRLLRNNGDGTFTDCSDQLDDSNAEQWTLSGAMCDVNQDGIADLIAVNYCSLKEHPEKPCPNEEGELGPCHPYRFAAQPNQFFAGTAEGRLVDVSSSWTAEIALGRGMGILAGSLIKGRLSVLIANDMSTNEFYVADAGGDFDAAGDDRLIESAALRGVAVDGGTRTQASMGIASGDFDGDGDLDLFVTGFAKEYDIYYEKISSGCWKDSSGSVGIVQPTLLNVGFGTEAVDLDDDGIDELVVTNGHIGDFGDETIRYKQPFQVFRRSARGKFSLLDDDSWGEYFSTPHVGRCVWTMDVDGDDRSDVMITHSREQVRLLLNRSRSDHNRISFKLVGTNSSRDAIGAVVRFTHGGRKRTLWCLSGDGYMCSNERVLRAGLGKADRVDNLTVTWQDGSIDELGTLDANAHYVIVQGDATAFKAD